MQRCLSWHNYRILQVIGSWMFSTKPWTIRFALSTFVSRAAPIPSDVEYGFGHPMLMSIADTSSWTIFATFIALLTSAVPIWKINFSFSIGDVRNSRNLFSSFTKSTVPRMSTVNDNKLITNFGMVKTYVPLLLTLRVANNILWSMISSV